MKFSGGRRWGSWHLLLACKCLGLEMVRDMGRVHVRLQEVEMAMATCTLAGQTALSFLTISVKMSFWMTTRKYARQVSMISQFRPSHTRILSTEGPLVAQLPISRRSNAPRIRRRHTQRPAFLCHPTYSRSCGFRSLVSQKRCSLPPV